MHGQKSGHRLIPAFRSAFMRPKKKNKVIAEPASFFLRFAGSREETGDERQEEEEEGKRRASRWVGLASHQAQEGSPDQPPQGNSSLHHFQIPNFLTVMEAKAFVEAAESLGFTHQGSQGPAKGEAYRDNDRIALSDAALAETIWKSGLKRIFDDIKLQGKVAVGLNPNIRFYRYKVGQRFGQHIDESIDLGEGQRTRYTLLVYLSGSSGSETQRDLESLVGGETVFYDDRRRIVAEVAPVEGMAVLHIHGHECMLHEARVVRKNVKYILRSDVVFA